MTELSEKYLECGGEFYHGEEAWAGEKEAGSVVSVFIEKYIKPAIQGVEAVDIPMLETITLNWTKQSVEISSSQSSYIIERK